MEKYLFTSEAVCCGHPDKICDKISDYILDEALRQDMDSRMAVEVSIKGEMIFIYGEASTMAKLCYKDLALKVMDDLGYDDDYEVIVNVSEQSLEISNAVGSDRLGAGDQGIMFGYACDDTDELMPLPIMLAQKIVYKLDSLKKSNSFLKSDGKSQVTVEYVDDKPNRVDTILLAICHDKGVDNDFLKSFIIREVIDKVVPSKYIDDKTKILINTSGSFTLGGPLADSGTTGRKIVSDSYGGMARVGGGCFSSKDASKVDRSAAYYARYVAKNVVFHKMALRCEIQVSYAIGLEEPVSLYVDCFGTNKVSYGEIYKYISDNFDFRVKNIISELDLKRPIYYDLACYGHFGRWDLNLTWERIKY